MRTSNDAGARLHDVLHRLPGMPAHTEAAELNANVPARRLNRRALRNRPLRNRPLRDLGGRQERSARLLGRWQAWLGRRFGAGQR
jgi:hypothetical protein